MASLSPRSRTKFCIPGRALRGLWLGAGLLALAASVSGRIASADEAADPASYQQYDIGDGKVTFDVTEAPFGQVVAERIQPKTRINIFVAPEAMNERVTMRVVDLHWIYVLDMMTEKINGALVRKSLNLLKVEHPPLVDVAAVNVDVGDVIKIISDFAGVNVVVSNLVKGNVTVMLKKAPWRAALQTVIETAGKFTLVQADYGILKVVPTSDLATIPGTYVFRYLRPPPPYKGVVKAGASGSSGASAAGGSGGGSGGSASTGADIVEGNAYIPSDDPKKASEDFPIIAALKSVLQPEGDATYIPGSNAVLFTGTEPKVARVKALCEQLDTEPPQIFIDMNFIATTNTNSLNMGLKSDSGVQVGLTGSGITHRLPFAASGGGWSDVVSGTNFPPPSAASFSYGTLDFGQTNLLFQFLKQDKCSKVVQAPKLLTLDNQSATIFVGESIRYARSSAASNQNGGLTFSVEEDQNSPVNVGFQLLVIPHVIPGENKIMLLVIPQRRALSGTTSPIPGFDRFTVSGQTIDLPRIASATLVTEMLLKSNETAVIGGLLEDRTEDGQDKIPVLGDLPLLGMLFRGTTKLKSQQNLIITITPRIIRGSDAANTTIGDELSGRKEKLAEEWNKVGGTAPAAPCAPTPAVVAAPPAPKSPPAPAPIPVAPR